MVTDPMTVRVERSKSEKELEHRGMMADWFPPIEGPAPPVEDRAAYLECLAELLDLWSEEE